MRFFIFLFAYIFSSTHTLVGQHLVDSLQNQLDGASDSLKVELYIELSKATVSYDIVNSLSYAQNAENLALQIDDKLLLAKSWNTEGVAYFYLNELDISNELYFKALSIFDSLQNAEGTANALNNIGWNYKVQEKLEDAVEYFNKALVYAKNANAENLEQAILNNLGTVYRNKKDYDKAMEIYQRSIEINRRSGNRQWEAYNLNNMGLVNMDLSNFDAALDFFEKAKAINSSLNFIQEYTRNTLNIAKVYILLKEHKKAESYLNDANAIIEAKGFKRLRLEYYEYMVDLEESKRDFRKALDYERKQNLLNNELNRLAYDEKVTEMQTKFEVAENERELYIAERKLDQQRLVIFSGIAMFLLLFGILMLVLKLYKTKNMWANNIQRLNSEIHDKAEALKFANAEVQGINANLEKLVEERTEKIRSQNEKLVKYAFINSHEIRGPLARVLGLIYMMGLENKILLNDQSFKMLNQATEELDEVVKSASQLLQDEDLGEL